MRILALFLLLSSLTSAGEPQIALAERRLFHLINRERTSRGVPALDWDAAVADEARRHSTNMERRRFFSHVDPRRGNPCERLTSVEVAWTACAENIYQVLGDPDPVASALRGWLRSPGHRKNLLARVYTHSGIGVSISPGGTVTLTQMFVRR